MTAYYGSKKVKKIYLGTPNTNCLTHIPNDINLELNNGTLTLKAGSKVYVPNGTSDKKYYKYTYSSWSQPTNPSGITATSGWTNVSNAFDNNSSTYAQCGTTTDYIEWNLGADVCLTGITATGNYASGSSRAANLVVKSIDSSGKETTLGTTTGATSSGTYNLSVTFSEKVVNKLRFYLANNDKGESPATSVKTRIREIKLTATRKRTVTESTASDYDYFVGAGTPIFDEVVVTKDLTYSQGYNDTRPLMVNAGGTVINGYTVAQTFSGSTAPTGSTYMFWYDTKNNIIKETHDSGATWSSTKYSFPFCIIKGGSGSVTSINQVFNGFGYIGSIIYGLPGVKGLIANGFNEDKTYNSTEFILEKVIVDHDISLFTSGTLQFVYKNNSNKFTLTNGAKYDSSTNLVKVTGNQVVILGDFTWESSDSKRITSLTPKKVQPEKTGRKINFIYKGSTMIYSDISTT